MSAKRPVVESRFQYRMMVITLLPVIALTLVSIAIAVLAYQSLTQKVVLDRNTALVRLAADSAEQELNNQLNLLQSTAYALAKRSGDLPAQQALLQELEPLLSSFEGGINLLDANGNAVAATSAAKTRLGMNYSFRPYFSEAWKQESPVFSTFLKEVPSGIPAVVIAVPVFHGNEMESLLIGVLFIQRHFWLESIQNLQPMIGAQAFLVDSQGAILYHPQVDRIGETVTDDAALRQLQNFTQATSQLDKNYAGGGRVISYAPIQGVGWGIMMTEPWRLLMQPARQYLYIIPGLMLVGLFLSLSLLLWMQRRTLMPLTALMKEAQNVADGGEFHKMPVAGSPEIALLLDTFNRMMATQQSQREALRIYAKKILEGQEEERKRISRELHDETVQDLVGLSQRLDLCRTAMVKDPFAANLRLSELQTLVSRALVDVRRMSNDLRPLILEDLGLVAAVKTMCKALKQDLPDADVEFQVIGPSYRLPSDLELVAFRVIQEALSNIRKHARGASFVQVEIEYTDHNLKARVIDDGPGFEVVKTNVLLQQGHLGIAGMAERISLFDGRLDIISAPGCGCRVELLLPF